MTEFFNTARAALNSCNIQCKSVLLQQLQSMLEHQTLNTDALPEQVIDPGRPALPMLVHPSEVPRRRLGSVRGRVGLIHAIAHIEYNAVNLALDAVYRFRGMPADYYGDWLRVAADESRHFAMLNNRLHELDSYYGALPAHGGMWEMAVQTDYDVGVRMALVPRVLEARGLDVTPAMIDKLRQHNDLKTVAILEQILEEEIDHVRVGNRWFKYACEQQSLAPMETFSRYLRKHGRIALRGPFNREARLQAGFTEAELAELTELEEEFKQSFASA
ncbi:MAG: ferritin-like domain-containing protein [Pseudomonadota bacterium]